MDDVEKVARGLTKAQREAVMASHWTARQDLADTQLCYWSRGPHGRRMVKFRPLGLAVRDYLIGKRMEDRT